MPVRDWIRILAFNLDLDWICFICSFACNASRVALCLLPHWQRASAPRAPLWSQRWQGLGRPASLAVHHMSAFWRDNADILKGDKISQRLRNAQNGTLAYGALNSTARIIFLYGNIAELKKNTFCLHLFIWSNTFPVAVSPFQVQRHMRLWEQKSVIGLNKRFFLHLLWFANKYHYEQYSYVPSICIRLSGLTTQNAQITYSSGILSGKALKLKLNAINISGPLRTKIYIHSSIMYLQYVLI